MSSRVGSESGRPLLAIDGDSFAHRAYHALPKTIRRRGNRGGGAILGFANFLLRLYETEQPRAVLVGWDTLDEPTYRHRALESYQAGREFDTELLDQLQVLPEFVAACGFVNAKAPGYEPTTSLPQRCPRRNGAAGQFSSRPGTAMPFNLRRRQRQSCSLFVPVRWRASDPPRCASGMGCSRARFLILSRSGVMRRIGFRVPRAWEPKVRPPFCANMARWRMRSRPDASRRRPSSFASTARSRQWTARCRFRRFAIKSPPGPRPPPWRGTGN